MKALIVYDKSRRVNNDKFIYYMEKYLGEKGFSTSIFFVEDFFAENGSEYASQNKKCSDVNISQNDIISDSFLCKKSINDEGCLSQNDIINDNFLCKKSINDEDCLSQNDIINESFLSQSEINDKYLLSQNVINNEKIICKNKKNSQGGERSQNELLNKMKNLLSGVKIVIMRTESSEFSRLAELCGVRVFNNLYVTKIFNDKIETYEYLQKLNIPFLEYNVLKGNIDEISCQVECDFPVVVKSASGHGGEQVAFVNSREELISAVCQVKAKIDCQTEYCKEKNNSIFYQKCSQVLGKDLRIYMIGENIEVAMLRESNGDFRANYKMGATATQVKASKNIENIAKKIAKSINSSYIGVDFVFDEFIEYGKVNQYNQVVLYNGQILPSCAECDFDFIIKGDKVYKTSKYYVNEVEDIVGCRMVYENTKIDLLKNYSQYIIHQLSKKD